MSNCTSTSACVGFGPSIQKSDRSGNDTTAFIGAKTLFGYENTNFVQNNLPKQFKSSRDYIRYQRAVAQLYSTSRPNPGPCSH